MNRSGFRYLVPAVVVVACLGALSLISCGGGGGGGGGGATPGASFPLHVESGKRYLVDAAGYPFLVNGDAAWSLIAQATDAEVDQYLEDRRQRGFNTILVSLLEHKFADNAPNTIAGVPPFDMPGQYDTPRSAYFSHAESVIQKAAAKGMLVLLTPSYLGFNGGDEGWYQEMAANGSAKMRDYGRYLGQRFPSTSFKNIIWVHGGDYNPPDKSLSREIALGILDMDAQSLHTAHGAPETSALGYWSGESWLQINTVYTYTNVLSNTGTAFAAAMPFIFLEGRYENEQMPEGSAQRTRVQAYQSILSGAFGHVFGNNPIWHFSSTATVFPSSPAGWQSWLGSPGSRSMSVLRGLLESQAWWQLVPDSSNVLLTDGFQGSGDVYDRAVAAKAGNGAFAVAYIPSSRPFVKVDTGQFAGPRIRARWYDPSSGTYSTVLGSPFLNSAGIQTLVPPGVNASGTFSDWALLFESIP